MRDSILLPHLDVEQRSEPAPNSESVSSTVPEPVLTSLPAHVVIQMEGGESEEEKNKTIPNDEHKTKNSKRTKKKRKKGKKIKKAKI